MNIKKDNIPASTTRTLQLEIELDIDDKLERIIKSYQNNPDGQKFKKGRVAGFLLTSAILREFENIKKDDVENLLNGGGVES